MKANSHPEVKSDCTCNKVFMWRWERRGFAFFHGVFRTPSSWTSSARHATTLLSPRWPAVVGLLVVWYISRCFFFRQAQDDGVLIGMEQKDAYAARCWETSDPEVDSGLRVLCLFRQRIHVLCHVLGLSEGFHIFHVVLFGS